MVRRSFDLMLSNPLKQLFQESEDIRLRAWGASEFGEVDYITFDGNLRSGGQCVIAHGACRVLDHRRSDELGRLSLWGFPSSLVRKIIDEDEYIHLLVDVYTVPGDKSVMRVGDLQLVVLGGKEVEIVITGLGEYRRARIKVKSQDGKDEWLIEPDGKLVYFGPEDEGAKRMPIWLRKAWLDWRL
jgi:hypothetical protein